MNRANNVSAIEGMHQDGFTLEEATRIRPFLPRRFYPFPSLYRTNFDAWEAIRAVKDALQYKRFEFKFIHKWTSGELLPHFHFQQNDYIEYISPTYHTRFLSIEFVRHFGEALYTDRSDNPNDGRLLVHVNGALKLKLMRLRDAYERVTATVETIRGPFSGDFNVTPFALPGEINNVGSAILALHAGYVEWFNINNPIGNGTWERYVVTTNPLHRALWLSLCKKVNPELLDFTFHYSHNSTAPNQRQWHYNWLPVIRLPHGELVGQMLPNFGNLEPRIVNPTEMFPQVEYYLGHTGWNCLLKIPQNVYDLFPREEWLKAFG